MPTPSRPSSVSTLPSPPGVRRRLVGDPARKAEQAMTDPDPRSVVVRVPDALKAISAPARIGDPATIVTIDSTDRQMINLLLADGRMSNRALATALKLSEVTVGIRLRRLVTDRILVFTALMDWEAVGYEWFALARINVEGRPPRHVAEDVSTIPNCISASVVFGSVDVLAYFLVQDRNALHELMDSALAKIDGIAKLSVDLATETHVTPFGRSTFLAQRVTDLTLPAPSLPLDTVDVGMIEALVADGRRSSRQIGRELGVSEGTIRARLARLNQAGMLSVVAMVNPLAIGMAGVVADVGLRVRRDAVSTVAEKLRQIREVVLVAVCVGTVDISVAIAAASRAELLDVVLDSIRGLDGVRATETLEMVDVVRFIPFFKRLDAV
jgi:DNA-binding Lrp family transcriptional regulator